MSAPALTIAAVRKLGPCEDSYTRVAAILPKRGKITAQQARDAGCTLDDIVWVAAEMAGRDAEISRRFRHWSADCAAHVLHIYEWACPNDQRPRNAIQAARDYADGLIDDAAMDAAADAAGASAWAADWSSDWSAGDVARAAAAAGVGVRSGSIAADVAADAAAAATAYAAELAFQFDRLILWLSDETPEPWPLPLAQKVAA